MTFLYSNCIFLLMACFSTFSKINADLSDRPRAKWSNREFNNERTDETSKHQDIAQGQILPLKIKSGLAFILTNNKNHLTGESKAVLGNQTLETLTNVEILDRVKNGQSSNSFAKNQDYKINESSKEIWEREHRRTLAKRSSTTQESQATAGQTGEHTQCRLQVSQNSINEFNKRILYEKADVLTLNLKFSKDLNVTWSNGVILPLKWIWVYQKTSTFLSMPYAATIWSLGLLALYRKEPVDIEIELGSQSCKKLYFTIGKEYTDAIIGDALANMTNEIASRELRYSTSRWCYMQKIPGSENKIDRTFDNNFFSVSPVLQYICCSYIPEIALKRRVQCSQKHHYDSVWWDVPLGVGVLMLLFFPLLFMKLTGKLHETIRKSSFRDTNAERNSANIQTDGNSVRPANETARQEKHDIVYRNGKSPITALTLVSSSVSNLIPAKESTKSRIAIFLWSLMTLIIPGIEVLAYYFYLNDYVKDLARNNISFGFSAMIVGWDAKDSKFTIFGGPFISLGLYILIGWILMLSPKVMANQIYRGVGESDVNIKSILCIYLERKENLGSVQIRQHRNGYSRLSKLQLCHMYMLLNPDYWLLAGTVMTTRFSKFMGILKQRISVKIVRGLIILLCFPFYTIFSFIEMLTAFVYYACPMFSFLVTVVKGFSLGINKYMSEKVSVRFPGLGSVLRVPLCVIVFLFLIYYLYIVTVLFLDGFFFLARILLFTFTAVVAYPRESYGYFMLILQSAYFGFRGFVKFGNVYKMILKIAIKLCKQDEILREYIVCNQDMDNNNIYGISRDLFEYLVEHIRPRRVQVFHTFIQLVSMIFILSVSIVLIERFDKFEDISLFVHVFITIFICAIPTIYNSTVSKDYIKVKMTRKIKRCLRTWVLTLHQNE